MPGAEACPEAPGRGPVEAAGASTPSDQLGMATASRHGNYVLEQVAFPSTRLELTGSLYIPRRLAEPAPSVVLLGPFGYVKEHAPDQYATRLADEGYVALSFDCAHHGESAGEPRQLVEPHRRIADVRAAIDFLVSRPEVDAAALAALGIGEGAAELVQAAVADRRIGAVVAVAARFRDPESDLERVAGDHPPTGTGAVDQMRLVEERLARARAAKRRFEDTGEVEYRPITDASRLDVALPGLAPWEWYSRRGGRGLWENRYAVMGDLCYLAFESLSAAAAIRVPVLVVHGELAPGAAAARRHVETMANAPVEVRFEEGTGEYDYYDDPRTIDRVAAEVAGWLARSR